MNIRHKLLLTALGCAAISVIALNAVAETAADTPSQEEIYRQLKTRGLPKFGPVPAPEPGSSPGMVPANAPSSHQPAGAPSPGSQPSASNPAAGGAPTVTFRSITFEFGSAQLRAESIKTLRNLGNALNQQLKDEKLFMIEGHTDRTGTRAYNDELSKQRADAVKAYLVDQMGVSTSRLDTVGKGFSEPADPHHPYAAVNRRVVVVNSGTP
jgi:OmpA-OmpF porin, OOP family